LGWPSIWVGGYPPPRATYPVAGRSGPLQGTTVLRPPSSATLFGLAPDGVCPAVPVAGNAVSSYLAISPLLGNCLAAVPWNSACAELHPGVNPRAVYFLWHFPSRRRAWPLASIPSYGARTFLQGILRERDSPAAIRPASRSDQEGGQDSNKAPGRTVQRCSAPRGAGFGSDFLRRDWYCLSALRALSKAWRRFSSPARHCLARGWVA